MHTTIHTGNLSTIYTAAPGVFVREGNLPIRDQCNTGIIVLDDCIAVIDLSNQDPDEEIFLEAEKITGLPVKYLLLTHAHGDHMIGMKTLHRTNYTLIARDTAIEEVKRNGIALPEQVISVTEDTTLELAGRKFALAIPAEHGHSPWDMLIGLPDCGLLFGGDLIAKRSDMYLHSACINGWIEDIGALMTELDTSYTEIVQGHGDIIPVSELADVKKYLEDLRSAADMTGDGKQETQEFRALYQSLVSRSVKKDVDRQIETVLNVEFD